MGSPSIIDFYLERDQVTAGFGDDLAKLLQLSTIYFDFDKYNIRKDSEIEVQKVIAAMEKYPSLKIKVNSHTDSRGRDAYNLMVIPKKGRIYSKLYDFERHLRRSIKRRRLWGDQIDEPLCNGVRCSAMEHEKNRRSEFIILE